MLTLTNVSKRYKKQIVIEGLSAEFSPGVTVITGPSGVGKTTLLRLCATVEKPTKGRLIWDGNDLVKNRRNFRQGLGYAPQIIDFPEDLTAAEFMTHIAAMKNIGSKKAAEQTTVIFDTIGLLPDLHKPIRSYSGGMRRRLGLAQAFLGDPKCLIIDEPTAELDPDTAAKVHGLIFKVAQNAVVLMTTHLEKSLSDHNYETLHMSGPSHG